ncbi:uncharacterized protein [Equus przewalskii]|uniref:Uncharacterized protein n=1 Tax=Equus przewalskii TaxID=9798 RepID=A0ABM4KI22_EQUPR
MHISPLRLQRALGHQISGPKFQAERVSPPRSAPPYCKSNPEDRPQTRTSAPLPRLAQQLQRCLHLPLHRVSFNNKCPYAITLYWPEPSWAAEEAAVSVPSRSEALQTDAPLRAARFPADENLEAQSVYVTCPGQVVNTAFRGEIWQKPGFFTARLPREPALSFPPASQARSSDPNVQDRGGPCPRGAQKAPSPFSPPRSCRSPRANPAPAGSQSQRGPRRTN